MVFIDYGSVRNGMSQSQMAVGNRTSKYLSIDTILDEDRKKTCNQNITYFEYQMNSIVENMFWLLSI